MNGLCKLCEKVTDLQLSHIIPKFVFAWLKETVPGGIRSNRVPNRRIQDGEKDYLLCRDCEQILSVWEKQFCEQIFIPLHSSSPVTNYIQYGPWVLKFAVSVSWRVLLYFSQFGISSHFSADQFSAANQALKTWRRFLLGEVPHPGRFEQHLLPLDVIERKSAPPISPFLNRYFLRNVDMDAACSNTSAFVFTKMCRLALFGFIKEENPRNWVGTKLHVKAGSIGPRDYVISKMIWTYFNERADRSAKLLANLSPRQRQSIRDGFKKDADKIAESEVFRAMSYDIAHSGNDAFKVTKPEDDGSESV